MVLTAAHAETGHGPPTAAHALPCPCVGAPSCATSWSHPVRRAPRIRSTRRCRQTLESWGELRTLPFQDRYRSCRNGRNAAVYGERKFGSWDSRPPTGSRAHHANAMPGRWETAAICAEAPRRRRGWAASVAVNHRSSGRVQVMPSFASRVQVSLLGLQASDEDENLPSLRWCAPSEVPTFNRDRPRLPSWRSRRTVAGRESASRRIGRRDIGGRSLLPCGVRDRRGRRGASFRRPVSR